MAKVENTDKANGATPADIAAQARAMAMATAQKKAEISNATSPAKAVVPAPVANSVEPMANVGDGTSPVAEVTTFIPTIPSTPPVNSLQVDAGLAGMYRRHDGKVNQFFNAIDAKRMIKLKMTQNGRPLWQKV